MCDLLERV
ncbi:hypothetical protein RDI58_019488 [Solanum bulbocastanum]|uniref:Uncharacterized protein n=1 Tax=Solanum bulbocastanum TaxID=147425 RepID=A0AAN8Y717_SOLBU